LRPGHSPLCLSQSSSSLKRLHHRCWQTIALRRACPSSNILAAL
jgi:hypothetical protein